MKAELVAVGSGRHLVATEGTPQLWLMYAKRVTHQSVP